MLGQDGEEPELERRQHDVLVPSADGALQEGAADLVSRLLPDTSDADWDAALATAQDYLLSIGITGWQDAIIGSFDGARDNLPVYLRAAEAVELALKQTLPDATVRNVDWHGS